MMMRRLFLFLAGQCDGIAMMKCENGRNHHTVAMIRVLDGGNTVRSAVLLHVRFTVSINLLPSVNIGILA
jgi:hypothetical protein